MSANTTKQPEALRIWILQDNEVFSAMISDHGPIGKMTGDGVVVDIVEIPIRDDFDGEKNPSELFQSLLKMAGALGQYSELGDCLATFACAFWVRGRAHKE